MLQKWFLLFAFLAVLGVPHAQAQNDHTVVMSLVTTGGLCPYGGCRDELVIYTDGTGVLRQGPQENAFSVDSKELTALSELIQKTDFDGLRSKKFTGLCPTAMDGSQYIYTFSTSHGYEVLDSCQSVLDEKNVLIVEVYKIRMMAYHSVSR